MKQIISLFLAISILAFGMNMNSYAENQDDGEIVSIPIKCESNFTFSNYNISGIIKGSNFYVKPHIIAKLAGYNDFTIGEGKNVYIYRNKNLTERVVYILDQSELMEISHRSESPTWKVDCFETASGEYYVNFSEMLKYMKAGVKYTEGEEYVSISFPYTLDQAIIDCHRTPSIIFSWEEVGNKSENSSSILLNSTLNSILLDYNSHLVTDAFFTWWNDEALNVTEEQYYDTLSEIMCYSSENYTDMSEDLDYAVYQTQNRAFSLTGDMAELLHIDLDEIKALGKAAELGGYAENIIDEINEYNLTRNISESMASILNDTLISPSSESLFADKSVKPLVVAANHLYNKIDNGALGRATAISDAIISAGRNLLSEEVSNINPLLKAIQATELIMKTTPGLSDLTEINEAVHTAANCYVIENLAFGEYGRLYSIYYESADDINTWQQMKNALILGTKASITARDILIEYGICSKYENSLRKTNRKLSALLSKFQSCEINPSEKYSIVDWSVFNDNSQINEDEEHSDYPTINLLDGYWENHIQSYGVYKFFEDGTVNEYHVLKNFINQGSSITSDDLAYSRTLNYEWDGKTLTINWGTSYKSLLKPVIKSSPIEWDIGLENQISEITDGEVFFYETDYVPSTEPGNAMYLVKSDIEDVFHNTNNSPTSFNETDLKSSMASKGHVAVWQYADYDGNGEKEAFAIITPNANDKKNYIEGVYFIDANGKISLMRSDYNFDYYSNVNGYYNEYNGKGFFSCDYGAYGSGWSTMLYSVKDGIPYELDIASQLQGFYKNGDCFYTTSSNFEKGYHTYTEIKLKYDANSQQFYK